MRSKLTIVTAVTLFVLAALGAATLGCYAGTAKEASRALSLQVPDLEKDPGFYFLLAEEAIARGDMKAVLKYYGKALALDPSSAFLYSRLAAIMERRRRIADAVILARLAIMFDPTYK